MRVLVVDQDSASNLAITRSLRDLYTVDCVTNKGDCLDLLRSNTFEVIVATERLEDGSGLELLGQISKKWPSVLRIFAAERQRLQLLRGRLGPFELFQTLVYPIDADKLLATLEMAVAAHNGDSQEVELPGDISTAADESAGASDAAEGPSEAPFVPFQVTRHDEPVDLEQSDEFSEPRFARAGRAEPMQAASAGRGVSSRGVSVGSGLGSGAGVASGQRGRAGAGVGSGASVGSGSGAGVGSGQRVGPRAGSGRGSGAPRARSVESGRNENDLAAKFPGSGTIGPRRGTALPGGRGVGGSSRGGSSGGGSGRGTGSLSRGGALGDASERGAGGLPRGNASSSGGRDFSRGSASGSGGRGFPRGGAPGSEGRDFSRGSASGSEAGGFADGGSAAPRSGTSGRAIRSGRSAASKAPPVRFPPLERTPPLERVPPLEPPHVRNAGGDFSEAAAMARAARSNYESSSDEVDTKRLATLIGGGVAVAAVVVFLAFKMFGSKSEAPKPAAAPIVAHAPEYPPEVTQLIAQTEAAFKADDFKAARADVERLRQLSPSHPRLDFFQSLLSSRPEGGRKTAASSSKKNGTKGGGTSTTAPKGDAPAPVVAKSDGEGSSGLPGASGAPSAGPSASATNSSAEAPGLMPETPVGLTRESAGSAAADGGSALGPGGGGANAPAAVAEASSTSVAGGSAGAASGAPSAATALGAAGGTSIASGVATTATAAPAPTQGPHTAGATSSTARRGAGEPPPVVQEAKLIRRVIPDYPSAAKKDGIAGSVDLEVTVSTQGVVENVKVIQSTPPDMFDKSAVAAVRKWKYDPRFVDGLPSQAHLKVHLEFGPNK